MFTYIQIFDQNNQTLNGYVAFSFEDGVLSFSFMNGPYASIREEIPIADVTNLSEDSQFGSQISFDYQGRHYNFINSGYGEAKYFKDSIIESVQV